MTSLHVEVVREHDAFLAIGPEWDALVERAGIDHPFLSHDWVRTWWEAFGAGKELYVLVVRTGETLVGLAPLMRVRTRMYGIPVWRLELIANVHTPRFDFIIAERADEVCSAILDHLQTQAPRWDILMLAELPGGSATESALERLGKSRSLHTGVWIAGASPRIPLLGSFDTFSAKLSSKRRGTLRQRRRRLALLGAVSTEVVSDIEPLAGALEDGLRIEGASWKAVAGTAVAGDNAVKGFYERLAERAARSKTLNLLFLKVGEKRIAFGYCLRHGRTLYLLKTGYDPEYADYSPFNCLLFSSIELAYSEGLQAIDLLGCDEPWKRVWTDQTIERHWLFLHRNTIRGLAIYYLKFVIIPRWKRWAHEPALTEKQPLPAAPAAPKLVRTAS